MASHKSELVKEDSPMQARTLVRCIAMQSAARVLSRLMSASSPKNSPGPLLPTILFCPYAQQVHAVNGAALPKKKENHDILLSQLRADQMPGLPQEGQLMCTISLGMRQIIEQHQ